MYGYLFNNFNIIIIICIGNITVNKLLLLLTICTLNVNAELIKTAPTLKAVTQCTQYIFNTNQLVENGKVTVVKAEARTKKCKALISHYDTKLNKSKKDFKYNETKRDIKGV